jgi:hypothetical protein
MAVRLSALRTRRILLPRNIIIFLPLVLISVKRLSKPQGLVRPEGLGKFKNSPHRVSNLRPYSGTKRNGKELETNESAATDQHTYILRYLQPHRSNRANAPISSSLSPHSESTDTHLYFIYQLPAALQQNYRRFTKSSKHGNR